MAYLGEAIDTHLSAATGDDPVLFQELRAAFVESARSQVNLLERSRCDGNWEITALRLKSLSATFHAAELMALADQALASAPGDPVIVRRLRALLNDLEPST